MGPGFKHRETQQSRNRRGSRVSRRLEHPAKLLINKKSYTLKRVRKFCGELVPVIPELSETRVEA